LIIANLEAVQPVMNALHLDNMAATTCRELPSLGRMEEYALFTYNTLVNPAQTRTLTVATLLYY
jgi:hypothetical protein